MKLPDFLLPFCVSAAIHVVIFLPGNWYRDAEVVLDKSVSAVTLNIVTSFSNREAGPSSSLDVREAARRKESDVEPTPKTEEIDILAVVPVDEKLKPPEKVVEEILPEPVSADIPDESAVREELVQVEQRRSASVSSAAVPVSHDVSRQGETEQADESEPYAHGREGGGAAAVHSGGSARLTAKTVGVPRPRYPRYSRRHGEEGTVVLSVEIRADGQRGKIEIVSSSGYSRLDWAAVQALERATFIPARVGDKPVSSRKRVAFTFRLEDPGN